MRNFSSEAPNAQRSPEDAGTVALFNRVVAGKLRLEAARRQLGLSGSALTDWLRSCRRAALLAFDEQLRERLIRRGAPAEALSGALFAGSVTELAVADLLQLFELAGKSAVLTVTNGGVQGQLWCSAGALIDAECGPLTGEQAAFRLLGWDSGSMVAELCSSGRPRALHCSTPQLLLEAARRKDECARLREALGDDRQVLQLASPAGSASAACAAGAAPAAPSQSERVLSIYFETPRSLRDVLAHSPLGDLETLAGVQSLLAAGRLVRTTSPPAEPPAANGLVRAPPEEASSWLPQRSGRPRWALDAVNNLLLIPAASWLGTKVSNALTPAAPPVRPHGKSS